MNASFETDWTREEFKAYLLSYVANSNYFETEDEKEVILGMVSGDIYKKIHKELAHDNDYQSIQKILYNLEKFHYSKNELDSLVSDIQRVFNAEGTHDILEENIIRALRRLFSTVS